MEFDSRGATESIADLNPEDIASMSVMTGAAASALYGSDAANGVVLITTRRGEAGRLQVHVSSTTEFLSPLQMPEFQSRYGTGRRGKSSGSTIHSWGERLPQAKRLRLLPQDDFLETGHVYTNSFSLQGGSEKNQTYFSAAAVNSDGLTPNNEYNRYNFTFRNTTHFLRDRLTLDAAASYVIQQDRNMTNQGVYSNPLVSAYSSPGATTSTSRGSSSGGTGPATSTSSTGPRAKGATCVCRTPTGSRTATPVITSAAAICSARRWRTRSSTGWTCRHA